MKFISKERLLPRTIVRDVEEDDEVESICVLNDFAPVVDFKDGSKVIFPWDYLCKVAKKFKKKQ